MIYVNTAGDQTISILHNHSYHMYKYLHALLQYDSMVLPMATHGRCLRVSEVLLVDMLYVCNVFIALKETWTPQHSHNLIYKTYMPYSSLFS